MTCFNSTARLTVAALGLALLAAPLSARAAGAPNPTLASGVAKASDYTAPVQPYVAAVDTPIFSGMDMFSSPTGSVKRASKLDVIAEAANHEWLLIGKGGTGVGYVPRSLATPAKYASQLVPPAPG